MISEPCCNCSGTGKVTVAWDFGAQATVDCSFCGGTGHVPKQMLITSPIKVGPKVRVSEEIVNDVAGNLVPKQSVTDMLNDAMAEVMKRYSENVAQQLYAPSPILDALKKSWVKPDEGKPLYRQEIQGDGPAV